MKKNIILADCSPDEVQSFLEGLNSVSDIKFEIIYSISNWGRSGKLSNLSRYLKYFSFPFIVFKDIHKYGTILGWQQFYTINIAFYSRLFHIKKSNILGALNFTYKRKSGFVGKLYYWYMKYSCNEYIDYYHVPSNLYADRVSKELGIKRNKFIVTCFGTPDVVSRHVNEVAPISNYSLAIGRSNRDFDFLLDVWLEPSLAPYKLVIAADSWKPLKNLPKNVIHKTDITPEDSFKWIKCCNMNITPIADGNIASGDTVLLNGMMFAVPTVITEPSTLAEMYIKNGVNGVCLPKDIKKASEILSNLLSDKEELRRLGEAARNNYEEHYTRYQMAIQLGKEMNL